MRQPLQQVTLGAAARCLLLNTSASACSMVPLQCCMTGKLLGRCGFTLWSHDVQVHAPHDAMGHRPDHQGPEGEQ